MVKPIAWHTLEEKEIFKKLETTREGLTLDEVVRRQLEFGPNRLLVRPAVSMMSIILAQFLSPLIYILLAAAVISVVIGERTDAMFILAILILNASLGAFQEWKAEQSALALQSLLRMQAHVRRNGEDRELPAEELVPGDICLLESGNRVPADIRLLEVNNLTIDESLLTGESLATVKSSSPLFDRQAPITDRTNSAFGGTTVMVGRGVGVVVEIGQQTEVAQIAKTVSESGETKPPLVVRMDQFARYISAGVVGACALLSVVAVSRGMAMADVFFMAVALAVSAIPEGLPVAMTIALSVATSRMAKRNVIVRKLTAVEGLGSCTFIASDKTGTLTVNQQTIKKILLPSGEGFGVLGQGYSGDGEVVSETEKGILPETMESLCRLGTVGILCNEAHLTCENGRWEQHGGCGRRRLAGLGVQVGPRSSTDEKSLDHMRTDSL